MKPTEIGNTIRSIRTRRGLTQTAFCRLYNRTAPKNLKLNQPTLARYESGDVMPPADKFLKIQSLDPDPVC